MNTQDKTSLPLTQEVLKMAKIFIENSDYKIVKIEQDIYVTKDGVIKAIDTELKKLRLDEMQSITEQEYYQEPVAWQWLKSGHMRKKIPKTATPEHWRPLYTHPHQDGTSTSEARDKEFVTLTDDEIKEFMGNCWESPYHLIKVIEQELKTKNGFSDVKEKNT
jgi:hypothetical protein